VAPPVVILPPATPTPSPSAQPAVAPATDSGGQVVNRVDTQQTVPVWLIVLLAISAMVNLAWLGLYLYKHYWLPPVEEGHPVAE
jgi:hypothetical protein